jgi:D-3-phosphoglycerate dehydrogenase
MVGQFTTILAAAKINIIEMLNKSKGNIAYNIVDVEGAVPAQTLAELNRIEGVIKVREIQKN